MEEYIATRFNNFNLIKFEETENDITFFISNSANTATCISCGLESKYIHQECKKEIEDVSYRNKATKIIFNSRKFKCKNEHCQLKVFTEKLPFIVSKKLYTSYLLNEIMKHKNKSIRTISSIIFENHKVLIPKSTIFDLINDEKNQNNSSNIEIIKLDKTQLEKNMDEKIDYIDEVTHNFADFSIEKVEEEFSLIDHISDNFKNMTDYNTTYSADLFIMAGLTSKIKNIVAVSNMPLAFTNYKTINKVGYNIFSRKKDGTYFSSGAFRDYLLSCEESKMQKCFKEFNNSLLKNNNITSSIYIIDATKIEVDKFNTNYENATSVKEDDKYTKGYKLSTIFGIKNDTLFHVTSQVDTIKKHDLVCGTELINSYNGFKDNDILLLDRGYLSFDLFYGLYKKNIYIATPAKKNSEVLRDALSIIGVPILDDIRKETDKQVENKIKKEPTNNVQWHKHPNLKRKNQEYTTVKDIKIYDDQVKSDTRKLEVNCAVIRFKKNASNEVEKDCKHYYEDDNYYYAVIYTTDLSRNGKDIILLYEKRMKIEECYRQLKSNWKLAKLTSTKYIFIVFQILTTIIAFGLVQLLTTLDKYKEFRNLSIETIDKKFDFNNKYKKTDLIIVSKETFFTYELADAFELFDTKSPKTKQEIIKLLRMKK